MMNILDFILQTAGSKVLSYLWGLMKEAWELIIRKVRVSLVRNDAYGLSLSFFVSVMLISVLIWDALASLNIMLGTYDLEPGIFMITVVSFIGAFASYRESVPF